eukprot:TRINITY_DN29403_c0_g1_i1.p1 TRINITY_DN29403_c0_g1~~TRINITY_DN29403_c0_g1_i1.p1  ORF type:complete len:257 (+),score=33.13 TRINITY_DN29403_c0_g1_i1:92-772(+)
MDSVKKVKRRRGGARKATGQLRLDQCAGVCRSRRPAIHCTSADLVRLHERLKKALAADKAARKLLKILHRLAVCSRHFAKAELVDALKQSGAGKTCANLKEHGDTEVCSFSQRLVESWRAAVRAPAVKQSIVEPCIVSSSSSSSSSSCSTEQDKSDEENDDDRAEPAEVVADRQSETVSEAATRADELRPASSEQVGVALAGHGVNEGAHASQPQTFKRLRRLKIV